MQTPDKDTITQALTRVVDPLTGGDIVTAGRLSGVLIDGMHVTVTLDVPIDDAPRFAATQADTQKVIEALPAVEKSTVVISTHSNAPRRDVPKQNTPQTNPANPNVTKRTPQQPAQQRAPAITLDGIGTAIAVASGKGGVGKSTTAINLAVALSHIGLRVGLLDADVYGPSVPIMTGLSEKPSVDETKKLKPLEAHGIKCMSLGFLMDANAPAVWRGPMVVGALEQMIREVNWAPLDVLLLDLPPGTGDVQLSLVQKVPLSGAVIVSTPQAVALGDVRKGIGLFDKTHVPIMGVIENMSSYVCPKCGHEEHIFGTEGAKAMAEELSLPFLGHIPLNISIRETGDAGKPIVAANPGSPSSQAYFRIAEKLAADFQVERRAAPEIIMED